ncbi:hypothetical protein Emed_005280 [Eimeria media]
MVNNQELQDFAILVGRSQRAASPPGVLTPARASLQLSYDAQVSAELFPITSATLHSFYQQQQASTWGLLGDAYDYEQCMHSVQSSVLGLLSSPNSGSQYSEERINAAAQTVSGVFAERVCGMRSMLSNVCLLAQQEIEHVASEIAFIAGKIVYRASQCKHLSLSRTSLSSLSPSSQQQQQQTTAAAAAAAAEEPPTPLLDFLSEHLELLLQGVLGLSEQQETTERMQFIQLPVRHYHTSIKPTNFAWSRSSQQTLLPFSATTNR